MNTIDKMFDFMSAISTCYLVGGYSDESTIRSKAKLKIKCYFSQFNL